MYAHVKFEYTTAFCEEAISSLIKFPEKFIKSVSFQMCEAIVFLFAGFTWGFVTEVQENVSMIN